MKLTVIGGGSSYTPELADGVIKNYATFPVTEITLVDIEEGRQKAEIICALLKRMFKRARLPIDVSASLDRRRALNGADFVISQFRAGGLAARSKDEKIPLKYGVIGQETTGPGGFANALRTIPEALALCRDIQQECPDAWLVNFTNPSGIITEAVLSHTGVKCIGLCNVPINMEREIIRALNMDTGSPKSREAFWSVNKSRVRCMFAGLNHLSFIGKLFVDGQDVLLSGDLPRIGESVVKNIAGPEIPADVIDAFRLIPSPYLRYYYMERDMLEEEMEKYRQTGKTRADEVRETEAVLFEKYRDETLAEKPEELSKRGGSLYSEAAVALMNSIWNDSGEIHVVNTLNRGAITDLPYDAVVETNCTIGRHGATPLAYGPLPKQISGLVHHVKCYERLTIEAALSGDVKKGVMALASNPLVRDVKLAKALFEDILAENKDYLGAFMRGAQNT
ncbi:MAG: 6-phospho-beta-glucosidase [Burkholderiales bacterium]